MSTRAGGKGKECKQMSVDLKSDDGRRGQGSSLQLGRKQKPTGWALEWLHLLTHEEANTHRS